MDGKVAFVSDGHISSVLHGATLFDVDLRKNSDLRDDSYSVDSTHLFELVDLFYRREAEPSALNRLIIVSFFNLRLLIKHDRVVILNTRVLLVRHLHLAIRKEVYLILYQFALIVFCLVVEERCLNLGTLVVDQLHVQERALPPSILPGLLIVFFRHSGFNLPVKQEGVQTLYGSVAV